VSEPGSAKALRYAVDEQPPHALAAMLGLQTVALILTGIVLVPIIVLTAAGRPEDIEWAVFAAVLICGATTILQARPVGPFGSGYALYMGTSGAFIAVCTSAAKEGGLPLLATLVLASSLIQFLFSARLSLFRRIVTPTVGGTVIMLIAVNVFPICAHMLAGVPEGVDPLSLAAPLTALATFSVIVAVSLYGSGQLRLWAPLIGIAVGCAVAWPTGILDVSEVSRASWFGLPTARWPGLDLSFDHRFLGLLPAFVIVTIIGAIETYGDGIAIQRVSRRDNAPVDFKAVQGAVNVDGLGNLLAGLIGTLPNTTYATSISVADLTRVGARRVAIYGGALILCVAFFPKISALLRAVPEAVAGAYVLVLITLLFGQGLRLVSAGGLSYENGLVVCLSFWLGVGFQNQMIFPEHLPGWSRSLLDNGMAAGGISAVLLTFLVSLRQRSGHRAILEPSVGSLPRMRELLDEAAAAAGWDAPAVHRLQLAGEEALIFLVERQAGHDKPHKIRLAIREEAGTLELEFQSGPEGTNLELQLSALHEAQPTPAEAGPRILRHMAKEVRHEQYHDLDSLTVVVDSRPLA
jgi:NCS2 family nucleobase:cation symporter-2/xanthine permease XanP